MAKVTKKYFDIDAIIEMARSYGVAENPLFVQTLNNYATVQKSIEQIDRILADEDMTTTKEYVKGRENLYLHPAIKELPKHIEAANKTLDKLLDIIEKLGSESRQHDELLNFLQNN